MNQKLIRIAFLCLCAVVTAAPSQGQRAVTVVFDDGRSPQEFPSWSLEPESEALYLRASDVALIFKATQFWNASSRKVVLGIGATRFTLTVDTRVVVVDGEPVMMRSPVRYDAGFVMIPLEFVLEVAGPYAPSMFDWDVDRRTLYVEKIGYNVQSVTYATTPERSTATITLGEPLVHHLDTSTPGLARLKIYGGRVDPPTVTTRESHGLFNGARAEQTDRDAFVYFDIRRETTRIMIERKDDPPRILVVLMKGELPEIPEPEFAGGRDIQVIDTGRRERRDLDIKTVVLDPGHGGQDEGKRGSSGILEKDVNLAVALLLADLIRRDLGLEVVLTREDDRLLSLTRRTEIANESGGDLFVSLHCNSWFSSDTGGFEAYFLSPARTDMDRAVAMSENAAADPGGASAIASDIDFILWDMVQSEYITESSHFAELVQKAMNERIDLRNRGVKQANFVVLQGARMPAVLVEMGFLSNPEEESLLASAAFQGKLAEVMVEAIREFGDRYR